MSDDKKNVTPAQAVGSLLLAGASIWFWFGGGLEHQAAREGARIEAQVAADAEAQYAIARRSGGPMDACVQAGIVAAAHLQAKDEPGYQRWQAIERADCERAGMPR